MKNFKLFICLSIVMAIILTSCINNGDSPPADPPSVEKGQINLGFGFPVRKKLRQLQNNLMQTQSASEHVTDIMISLEKEGVAVWTDKIIPLLHFGDAYVTDILELEVGTYQITKFLVIDQDQSPTRVVYATPVSGSVNAHLVNDPLEIEVVVIANQLSTIKPEVLVVDENSIPQDFGYPSFGFELVDSLQIFVNVFAFNPASQQFEDMESHITIQANMVNLTDKDLVIGVNRLWIKDLDEDYAITVSKVGYESSIHSFTRAELAEYQTRVLKVNLGSSLVSLEGSVFDATLANIKVSLMELGKVTPLVDPVYSNQEGGFTFENVNFAALNPKKMLYLQAEGRGNDLQCDNTINSDTYVDINDNQQYDASEDYCIGDKAALKSFLGTAEYLMALRVEQNGKLDSAMLEELQVSHLTTANFSLIQGLLNDVTDDVTAESYHEKAAYIKGVIDSQSANDEAVQKQLAKLSTIIRSYHHEKIASATNLDTKIQTAGSLEQFLYEIVTGGMSLNTEDDAFINQEFHNDESGFLNTYLGIASNEDLSTVVTYHHPEIEANLTDFENTKSLNSQFLEILKTWGALFANRTVTQSEIEAYDSLYAHPTFLRNGRTSSQFHHGTVQWFTENPILEIIFLEAYLSRLLNKNGAVFYDPTTETFTDSSTDGTHFPVYRRLCKGVERYANKPSDPGTCGGYGIIDGEGKLKRIGNRVKFDVRLSSVNNGRERQLKLRVRDPFQETSGGRFEITSVLVEVSGDPSMDALTAEELSYRGSSTQKFKVDCSLADAEADNTDLLCLNRFYLRSVVNGDGWANWHHRYRPGSTDAWGNVVIPYAWIPREGSTYTFSITYNDTETSSPDQTEIIEMKAGKFFTDDFLPKLTDESGHLIGQEVIGDDSGIEINWVYKANQAAGRRFFGTEVNQKIWLWDPLTKTNVSAPEIGTSLSSSLRNTHITTDLSSYRLLELGIKLQVRKGGELLSRFRFFRQADGSWLISQWIDPFLEDEYIQREDFVDWHFSTKEHVSLYSHSNGTIAPAVVFQEESFRPEFWDQIPTDNLSYDPWKSVWRADICFYYTDHTPVQFPWLSLTYTPYYSNQEQTIKAYRLFDKITDAYLPQNFEVTRVSDQLTLTWDPPATSEGLDSESPYAVSIKVSNGETENYLVHWEESKDNTYIYNVPLPVDVTHLSFMVAGIYYDWLTRGRIELKCTLYQLEHDMCHAGYRQEAEETLIVDNSKVLRSFPADGEAAFFNFQGTANQAYQVIVETDATTDLLRLLKVENSSWEPVGRKSYGGWENPLWVVVPASTSSENYHILLADKQDGFDPTFDIQVVSIDIDPLVLDVTTFGTIQSGVPKFHSFNLTSDTDYFVSVVADASSCSGGGYASVDTYLDYGDDHWQGYGGSGFNFQSTRSFIKTNLQPAMLYQRIEPNTDDPFPDGCIYETLITESTLDGSDPANALNLAISETNLGRVSLNEKRYYSFTAGETRDYRFSVGGQSALNWTLFSDIGLTTEVATCNPVHGDPWEWERLDCIIELSAGSSYFLEINKIGGEEISNYNFSINPN